MLNAPGIVRCTEDFESQEVADGRIEQQVIEDEGDQILLFFDENEQLIPDMPITNSSFRNEVDPL